MVRSSSSTTLHTTHMHALRKRQPPRLTVPPCGPSPAPEHAVFLRTSSNLNTQTGHTRTYVDVASVNRQPLARPGRMPPATVAAAPQPGPPPRSSHRYTPPSRRRRAAAAAPPRRRTWLEPRPRGGQSAEQPLERLLLNPGPLRNRKATGARPASTLRRHLQEKEDATRKKKTQPGNVIRQAQLATASAKRPQTKSGGTSVARRGCGRLINQTRAFFRARPPQKFTRATRRHAWLAAGDENGQAPRQPAIL